MTIKSAALYGIGAYVIWILLRQKAAPVAPPQSSIAITAGPTFTPAQNPREMPWIPSPGANDLGTGGSVFSGDPLTFP